MSTEIEHRVVQMTFDNEHFEKNAEATISTLDKLKEKLNFKGAAKGTDELVRAFDGVDGSVEDLTNTVSKLELSFSALEVASISAISRLTNKVIDAGEHLVKSLSVDQITSGFDKYEASLNATRTIMSATGKSIEEVDYQVERLGVFADETSFSLTDMTNNVSKFTSNLVDLKVAVPAMMGIASAAGLAGVSAEKASHAMEGFSKAIAKGYMDRQNWSWIRTANMDTAEFKQQIIDSAVAMGELIDVGNGLYKTLSGKTVSVEDFETQLSTGWLSKNVALDALNKYGSYAVKVIDLMNDMNIEAVEAMEILDKYIEETGDEVLAFSAKAFKASQEYKTFTDAIVATKDAVSTGWMRSFKLIFGNLEEAAQTWTELGTTLFDIFAAGSKARNDMLSGWVELGGRGKLLEGIHNMFHAIYDLVLKLKSGFRDLFPAMTAERLYNMTNNFAKFTEKLKLSEEAMETLRVLFKAVLIPVKAFVSVIQIAAFWVKEFVGAIFTLIDSILSLPQHLDKVENFFKKLFGEEKYERAAAAFATIIQNIKDLFVNLTTAIGNWLRNNDIVPKLTKAASYLGTLLKPIVEFLIEGFVNTLERLSKLDFSNVINLGAKFFQKIVDIAGSIELFAGKKWTNLTSFFTSLKDATPQDVLIGIAKGFGTVGTAWKNFESKFTFTGFINNINAKVKTFSSTVGEALSNVTGSLVDLMKRLSPAKIMAFGFGTSMVSLMFSISKAFESVSGALTGLKGTFGALTDYLKRGKTRDSMLFVLAFIAEVAALSFLDQDKLWSSVKAVMAISAIVAALGGAMAWISKTNFSGKKLDKIGASLRSLALVVISTAAAITLILSMTSTYDDAAIVSAMSTLFVTIMSFTFLVFLLSKIDMKGTKAAWTMVAIAMALSVAVGAFESFLQLDFRLVDEQLGALAVAIATFATLAATTGAASFAGAAGLTLMVADLFLIYKLFKSMEYISADEVKAKLGAITVLIVGISSVVATAYFLDSKAGHAKDAATALIKITGALALMALAIKLFNTIDFSWRTLASIGTMTAIVFGFVMLSKALGKMDSNWNEVNVSKALLNLSKAMLPIAIAMRILAGLSFGEMAQGVVAIGTLMGILTLLVKYMSTTVSKDKELAITTKKIIALIAAIGVLIGAIVVLSLMDTKQVLGSAAAIATVMAALAVLIKSISGFGKDMSGGGFKSFLKDIGNIIKIFGTIGLIAIEMIWLMRELEDINPDGIIEKALAVGVLLTAFSIVTASIQKISKGISQWTDENGAFNKAAGMFIKTSAILTGIVIVISALAKGATKLLGDDYLSSVQQFTNAFLVLIPFLATASAVTYAFIKFSSEIAGIDLKSAAKGIFDVFALLAETILGIIINLGEILLGIAGLGLLTDKLKIAEKAEKLGEVIGGFFGSIMGSFTAARMNYMAKAAPQMVEFVETLMPLYDVFSKAEIIEGGAKQLANAMDELAGINVNIAYERTKEWSDTLQIITPRIIAFATDVFNAGLGESAAVDRMKNAADTIREFSGVNDALREAYSSTGTIQNQLRDNLLAMVRTISTNHQSFKNAGRDIIKGITDSLKSNYNLLYSMGDKLIETLNEWFNNNKYKLNASGEYIITGIVDGASKAKEDNYSELRAVFEDILNIAKDVFGINSPSKMFMEIGAYCMAGLTKGMQDESKNVQTATGFAAKAVLSVFLKTFKIHSPSLVMKEVGHYVMQGLAEGLDTDMSAEEIAAGKAQNIAEAFEKELNKRLHNLDLDTAKIEQMELLGLDPKEIDKAYAELEEKELQNQGMKVASAKEQYRLIAKEFGENSKEAKEAQATFIKNQNELINLEKQLEENRSNRVQERADARAEARENEIAVANRMSSAVQKLRKMGVTDEMVQQMGLGNKVGDIAKTTTGFDKLITKKIEQDFSAVSDKLTELEEKYVKPYEFTTEIDPTTAIISKAKESGSSFASEFSAGAGEYFETNADNWLDEYFNGTVESATENAKETVKGVFESGIDWLSDQIDNLTTGGTTKLKGALFGAEEEVKNSTSIVLEGIRTQTDESMKETVENAVATVDEAGQMIDEGLSVEPVIAPYIDDTEFEKGVSKIEVRLAGLSAGLVTKAVANQKAGGSSGNTSNVTNNNTDVTVNQNFYTKDPPTQKDLTKANRDAAKAYTK